MEPTGITGTKKFTPEIRDALRAPFPEEAIKAHDNKPYLSTIKAIYITERLNDIFGLGGWTVDHKIVDDQPDYVSVSGSLYIYDFNYRGPVQYGGHKKTGKGTEPADGYKSAVTDLLSKCASYLEIGIDVFKGKAKAKAPPSQGSGKAPSGNAPGPDPNKASPKQGTLVVMEFEKLAKETPLAKNLYREARISFMRIITKNLAINSTKDLTKKNASDLIDFLQKKPERVGDFISKFIDQTNAAGTGGE